MKIEIQSLWESCWSNVSRILRVPEILHSNLFDRMTFLRMMLILIVKYSETHRDFWKRRNDRRRGLHFLISCDKGNGNPINEKRREKDHEEAAGLYKF
jgi:hypothetical protein